MDYLESTLLDGELSILRRNTSHTSLIDGKCMLPWGNYSDTNSNIVKTRCTMSKLTCSLRSINGNRAQVG